ncbi:EamA family transporter [Patescibacteria group bacterium]
MILTFYQIPKIDSIFILSLLVSSSLSVVAALLAYKAIKESDISLVNPISAFNPVFTSLVSFFTLKEVIGVKGALGILFIVVGAYLLQISKFKKGVLEPFKALIVHKGVQMSFLAYFIWSITPIFEKTAILHTTPGVPPFASLIGGLIAIPVYLILVRKEIKSIPFQIKVNFKTLLLIGAVGAVGQTCAYMAFSLTNLGFATAIFKLSMVFTVILGWIFFKEKDIKQRLLGSLVMLIGVTLLIA